MKFTNNRKKSVNLSAKSSGRYNWENACVVFEKEIRKYEKTGIHKNKTLSEAEKGIPEER